MRLGLRGARVRGGGTRYAGGGFRSGRGRAGPIHSRTTGRSRASGGFLRGGPRQALRSRLREGVPVLAAESAAAALRGARGGAARSAREDRGILLLRGRRARPAVRAEIRGAGGASLHALRANRGQGRRRLDPDLRGKGALEGVEDQKYFATDLRSTLPPERIT